MAWPYTHAPGGNLCCCPPWCNGNDIGVQCTGEQPYFYLLTLSGVANGTCSQCDNFNGDTLLQLYSPLGGPYDYLTHRRNHISPPCGPGTAWGVIEFSMTHEVATLRIGTEGQAPLEQDVIGTLQDFNDVANLCIGHTWNCTFNTQVPVPKCDLTNALGIVTAYAPTRSDAFIGCP